MPTTSSDLKQRREACGLSQIDVAQRAKCSPAMVGMLERGYEPQRSAVLARIKRVLREAQR